MRVQVPLPGGRVFPIRMAIAPGGRVTAITQTGTFEQGKAVLLHIIEKTLKTKGIQLENVRFESHVHQGVAPQLAYNQRRTV